MRDVFQRSSFRQALPLLAGALLLSVLTALLHPQAPVWSEPPLEPGQVWLETALSWENVLWLDARSRAEYTEAHIPGALLLNEDEWEDGFLRLLDVWEPGQNVVVYCGGARCQASQKVAERLRAEMGGEEIHVLAGGWRKGEEKS